MATEALGENAKITIGVEILCVRTARVSVSPAPNKIPTTSTCSEGFTRKTRGPRESVVDVTMQWRPEDNPFGNPPNLEPGDDNEDGTVIYPDFTFDDLNFYDYPIIYVVSSQVDINAEGVQDISLQFENQGKFYTPARRLGVLNP